jgi:hypothetical protein
MKNTMDTFEAPKWFQDIQKPKWMGGDDDDNGGESDIRRWFGGGGGGGSSSSGEGRIRL